MVFFLFLCLFLTASLAVYHKYKCPSTTQRDHISPHLRNTLMHTEMFDSRLLCKTSKVWWFRSRLKLTVVVTITFRLDIPVHSSSHPHAWVGSSVNLRICSPQPFHCANTSSRILCNQTNTRLTTSQTAVSYLRPTSPLNTQQIQLRGNSPPLENTENLIPSRTRKPWFKLEGGFGGLYARVLRVC